MKGTIHRYFKEGQWTKQLRPMRSMTIGSFTVMIATTAQVVF